MTSITKFSYVTQLIVDVETWPKFGNSYVSMRAVIITSILQVFE